MSRLEEVEDALQERQNALQLCENQAAELEAELVGQQLERDSIREEIQELSAVKERLFDWDDKSDSPGLSLPERTSGGINYLQDEFSWSRRVLKTAVKHFQGFEAFRHVQRGVVNASLDSRDVICIMPTGGGKSLAFQLPAILGDGVTLVVAPLVSLINDQVLHLVENGIEAAAFTHLTPLEAAYDYETRLLATANNIKIDHPIKLCYVTPEKLVKSDNFRTLLERLNFGGMLDRIVLDEAHTFPEHHTHQSILSHNSGSKVFREAFRLVPKILRELCSGVPITMLTATCSADVLKNLVKMFRLPSLVDGADAPQTGTTLFRSPLHRPNLVYSVVTIPDKKQRLDYMVNYIQRSHRKHSGIIYCATTKDCEKLASALREATNDKITTEYYHGGRSDKQKEVAHTRWLAGEVNVMCATNAFGLGIDKPDVRFVMHQKLSTSFDAYVQESGRAGRDGNHADCILFFRPQDYSDVAAIVGQDRVKQCFRIANHSDLLKYKLLRDAKAFILTLKPILRYALNLQQCRKDYFDEFFAFRSDAHAKSQALDTTGSCCGCCDNCHRLTAQVKEADRKIEAWQVLKLGQALQCRGNFSVAQLATLSRAVKGTHGKALTRAAAARHSTKDMSNATVAGVSIDLDELCGGHVQISQEDTERLILHLLLQDYLQASVVLQQYCAQVYVRLGPRASSITGLDRQDVSVQALQQFQISSSEPLEKDNSLKKARNNQAPDHDSEDWVGDLYPIALAVVDSLHTHLPSKSSDELEDRPVFSRSVRSDISAKDAQRGKHIIKGCTSQLSQSVCRHSSLKRPLKSPGHPQRPNKRSKYYFDYSDE